MMEVGWLVSVRHGWTVGVEVGGRKRQSACAARSSPRSFSLSLLSRSSIVVIGEMNTFEKMGEALECRLGYRRKENRLRFSSIAIVWWHQHPSLSSISLSRSSHRNFPPLLLVDGGFEEGFERKRETNLYI
ncbi:hypothetical protein AVEN_223797-1 [Araneus ventricosus]|uniref:Uncharacterized protein n=1 Tax=Araneus ventricosus TaxID=182803 RepID=A0A4Y2DM57_ARAVE|nr:hypothetical protein AVEN_223797-1 [Araneus ventricosus]